MPYDIYTLFVLGLSRARHSFRFSFPQAAYSLTHSSWTNSMTSSPSRAWGISITSYDWGNGAASEAVMRIKSHFSELFEPPA